MLTIDNLRVIDESHVPDTLTPGRQVLDMLHRLNGQPVDLSHQLIIRAIANNDCFEIDTYPYNSSCYVNRLTLLNTVFPYLESLGLDAGSDALRLNYEPPAERVTGQPAPTYDTDAIQRAWQGVNHPDTPSATTPPDVPEGFEATDDPHTFRVAEEEIQAEEERVNQSMEDEAQEDAQQQEENAVEEQPETIPQIPASQDIEENTTRFQGAPWFNAIRLVDVTVAGAGGIGSYLIYALSRLKVNHILIYDPDTVEDGNMSGQLYRGDDTGTFKTDAIQNIVRSFSGYYSFNAIHARFNNSTPAPDILFCGFDNMDSRKMAFIKWKEKAINSNDPGKCLFVDGRMNAESFQVFCITGDSTYRMRQYEEKWLFSDEEADEGYCSYKQTSHMGMMIGGYMASLLVNFVCRREGLVRNLPFFTEFNGTTLQTRIK